MPANKHIELLRRHGWKRRIHNVESNLLTGGYRFCFCIRNHGWRQVNTGNNMAQLGEDNTQ